MTWRRAGIGALAAAVLVVVVLAVQGSYERFGPAVLGPLERPAPSWTRPCWRRPPGKPLYTVRCARVKGIVVYVEQEDADGDGDRHAVIFAGVRPVRVKYPRDVGPRRLPGIGSRLEAVGAQPASGVLPEVVVADP
jgi:hypothetical protein